MQGITRYMTVVHHLCSKCEYLNKIGDIGSEPVSLIACGKCGEIIYTDNEIDDKSANDIIKQVIEESL